MSILLFLVFIVTLVAFPVLWWKKRKAKQAFGPDSEEYRKASRIKRIVGIVCVVSLIADGYFLDQDGRPATPPQPAAKQEQAAQPAKEKHIYDKAKVVDMMNGMGTKAIGKVSIIEAQSTDVTQEALEDWYFNYVKPHEKEFNYCLILYTDKNKKEGVLCSAGVLTKDTPLEKDKYGETYSKTQSGGTIWGPTDDGHLKEIK